MPMPKSHSRTVLKVYLMIATLIWLIWLLIWYGQLASSTLSYLIIDDQEYISSDRYYEMRSCEDPDFTHSWDKIIKSELKITECEKEMEEEMILRRQVEFKEDLINGIVWGTLFLVVFLLHYPRFLRENK